MMAGVFVLQPCIITVVLLAEIEEREEETTFSLASPGRIDGRGRMCFFSLQRNILTSSFWLHRSPFNEDPLKPSGYVVGGLFYDWFPAGMFIPQKITSCLRSKHEASQAGGHL